MKKLSLFLGFIFALTLTACAQNDGIFDQVIKANKGIQFPDGTIMLTVPNVGTTVTWSTLVGKPTFATVATSGSYTDLINKPVEVGLGDALPALNYLGLPQKTTAQINALNIPSGVIAMVWDKDLKCLKVWNGTIWKIYIANQ